MFLNVAGGLRISEPAADLAAAAALCSSLFDIALPAQHAVFGEVALSGAIRPVSQSEARLKEAQKLGLLGALAPGDITMKGLRVKDVTNLADLIAWVRANG